MFIFVGHLAINSKLNSKYCRLAYLKHPVGKNFNPYRTNFHLLRKNIKTIAHEKTSSEELRSHKISSRQSFHSLFAKKIDINV